MTQPLNSLKIQIERAIHAVQAADEIKLDSGLAPTLTAVKVAGLIDHTLLKPEVQEAQIRRLCVEAAEYGFASVCVQPTWVTLCVALLASTPVKTCTVIGFPLGATLSVVKAHETAEVLRLGAQEVDMVINVGRLKDGDYATVYADIAGVARAAHDYGALAKVIIETALLSQAEKIAACVISQQAGADFVKTSTGFNGGGATVADVALMRRVMGSQMGVKASGGIRTAADAQQVVAAGATRIGASAGVQIVQDWSAQTGMNDKQATAGETY
ncbi:MAG: deoxyribose-phosphate aldolase [Chloroflexota bacterium]|nr:deoxyribose-phosphate aldolase [Chloroflexota bacterium]